MLQMFWLVCEVKLLNSSSNYNLHCTSNKCCHYKNRDIWHSSQQMHFSYIRRCQRGLLSASLKQEHI